MNVSFKTHQNIERNKGCKKNWHEFSMVFLQKFLSNSGNTPAEKTLRQALVGDGLSMFLPPFGSFWILLAEFGMAYWVYHIRESDHPHFEKFISSFTLW